MSRIAIGGFMHESNSFVPGGSDFELFDGLTADRPRLSRGEEILERLGSTTFATAGFLDALGAEREVLPTVWGSTLAGPPVTERAYERIAAELVGRLSALLPVDAVYLDLHGAMVAAHQEDGEGELLRRVRAAVGADVPIAISLDYHCNFTPLMASCADAVLAYRTYPHVDQYETGQRAAAVIGPLLERGRPPARALRKMPFLLPLNFQCTLVEPTRGVVDLVTGLEGGDVLTSAYLAGFPPSDLFYCGPSVVVHGYSGERVEAAAGEAAQAIARLEADFAEPLLDADAAVKRALELAAGASRPVVIADTQDNPGCGGSGDSTGVLEALRANRARGALFGLLCDGEAAAAAHAAGVGARIDLALGGRSGVEGVEPCHGTFTVERLTDGRFTATGPIARGREMNLGPSALLDLDGIRVAVSTGRAQTHDQSIYRHLGLEPSEQPIVVVKSTCHFRADFQPIAEEVLVAIAPGGYVSDPARYPYRRLRRGVRLSPLGPEHDPDVGR